jgi:hypothetical protein
MPRDCQEATKGDVNPQRKPSCQGSAEAKVSRLSRSHTPGGCTAMDLNAEPADYESRIGLLGGAAEANRALSTRDRRPSDAGLRGRQGPRSVHAEHILNTAAGTGGCSPKRESRPLGRPGQRRDQAPLFDPAVHRRGPASGTGQPECAHLPRHGFTCQAAAGRAPEVTPVGIMHGLNKLGRDDNVGTAFQARLPRGLRDERACCAARNREWLQRFKNAKTV